MVTLKFVEYNWPDSKHTEVNEVFPFRVRDCFLLFYTLPLAPRRIISPPPLALALEKERRKSKGREGGTK